MYATLVVQEKYCKRRNNLLWVKASAAHATELHDQVVILESKIANTFKEKSVNPFLKPGGQMNSSLRKFHSYLNFRRLVAAIIKSSTTSAFSSAENNFQCLANKATD